LKLLPMEVDLPYLFPHPLEACARLLTKNGRNDGGQGE